MKKSKFLLVSTAVAILANSFAIKANACGPFIPEAILAFDNNPDLPLKQFVDGELGIVRPTWAKSYLVVAYRQLVNKPLTTLQREGAYSLWRDRIGQSVFYDAADDAKSGADKNGKLSGFALWQKSRAAVPAVKPIVSLDVSRSLGGESYDTFLNCPDSAFDSAAKLLQAKITKHGASTPFVKDWVAAQDLVFCHCSTPGGAYDAGAKKSGKSEEPAFPASPKDSHDVELLEDRAYQHAAALFYAEKYDEAFKEFEIISAETSNPYAKIARYMMPRCLIRKATVTEHDTKLLQATYSQAEKLLHAMIDDPGMASMHEDCRELLGFVLFRSDPTNRLKELSARLLSEDKAVTAAQYYRSLDDYTQLLLNLQGGIQDEDADPKAKKPPIPAAAKNDDLSDWITIWERNDKAQFAYAVDRWHHQHSDAWLLAAMHLAPKDKGPTDELVKAALLVKPDSPAFLSIGYELARLYLLRGELADVSKQTEQLKEVAEKKKLWSATNLLMDARGKAPITVEQFVENSVRVPAAVAVFDEYLDDQFAANPSRKKKSTNKVVFGFANAEFVNERMPLIVVSQIALSKLPARLQADAEQAAWVRAILLNDAASRDKLTPALMRDYPKLAPLIKATTVGSDSDKKFAAAYLILKNPGMRPYITGGASRAEDFGKLDTYGDNWWDAVLPDQSVKYTDKGEIVKSKLNGDEFPRLLSADQAKLGLENKKQLLATGAAPTFLCSVVADFAATHKSDPRVPEALHLAVRSSHYGHREGKTTPLSKKCFTLLHTNYPKNAFSAQTPYFY